MADTKESVTGEINNAIESLCTQTQTSYVNFFDKSTQSPENLTRPIGSVRYIFPTGSFAFGEWNYGDDVHLVILTPVSRNLTWSLLTEQLDIDVTRVTTFTDDLTLSAPCLSRNKTGDQSLLGKFAALSGRNKTDCKFYLHYCEVPPEFDPATMNVDMIPGHEHARATAKYNLDLLRDTQFLAIATVGTLETPARTQFREAYHGLRRWMGIRGLLAPRLGFFDSECITWVVCRALREERLLGTGRSARSQHDLLTITLTFLRLKCSNTADPTAIEFNIRSETRRNVSREITPEAKFAMVDALLYMSSVLWPENYDEGLHQFMKSYEYFLIIDCCSWYQSTSYKALFYEDTVPRNIRAVMKFLRQRYAATPALQGPRSRLWAAALVENDEEFHECKYAVSLTWISQTMDGPINSFDGVIDGIVADIEGENVLSFPVDNSLITVAAAKRADLQSLLQENETSAAATGLSNLSLATPPAGERHAPSGRRFRTAAEAISRLRYHPRHASVEYDLAYEDRFKGLVWMGLEDWGGKETEDENFIPAHRVRVLRRREDRVVVWNRARRVDFPGMYT